MAYQTNTLLRGISLAPNINFFKYRLEACEFPVRISILFDIDPKFFEQTFSTQ